MAASSQSDIEHRLLGEDLDEWLRLWRVEQGAAKPAALELMARVIPFGGEKALRVLDLCSGPGDVGRAIFARFPQAQVDAIDRDPLLISLCKLANARSGIAGRAVLQDLDDPQWRRLVDDDYDVVAIGYALHWFTLGRARALLGEVRGLLRPGGVLLFMEPVSATQMFRAGFETWRAERRPQHDRADWLAFWSRANAFLGYQHMNLGGSPPAGRIGDGLTVAQWTALVEQAGFVGVDSLLRDADKAVIGAATPAD